MAAANQNAPMEAQVQSSFPLPPKIYFEQFTNEAVCLGKTPKPPEPIGNTYQMFGQVCHQDDPIIRPLESQNLVRLHPQVYDKRKELKKMSISIICNFLDLLDVIVKAADSPMRDEKLEDLNLLFIHIHHLINEFRPHQARETLKVLMEMQQKQVLDVGEKLWKHIEKAENILRKCTDQLRELEAKEPADTMFMEPQGTSQNTEFSQMNLSGGSGIGGELLDDKSHIMMSLIDKIDE